MSSYRYHLRSNLGPFYNHALRIGAAPTPCSGLHISLGPFPRTVILA